MAVLFDSYSETNADNDGIIGGGTTTDARAQSITAAANAHLVQVKFYLSKRGSPTGNITAVLYAHTGVFGVSSLPTGPALATSDVVDITTLSTTRTLVTFNFPTPYLMTNGTNYVISCEYSGGTTSNDLLFGLDTISPTHPGIAPRRTAGVWVTGTSDSIFYAYDNTDITTSTSSTSSSISTSSTSSSISTSSTSTSSTSSSFSTSSTSVSSSTSSSVSTSTTIISTDIPIGSISNNSIHGYSNSIFRPRHRIIRYR